MTKPSITRLVERAVSEPDFLHQLMFSPDSVIAEFSLTLDEQKAITAHSPEDLFGLVVQGGEQLECVPNTCQATCEYTRIRDQGDASDAVVIYKQPLSSGLNQLIERARTDAIFFATLADNPQVALQDIPLAPHERAAITANTSERLLGVMLDATFAVRSGCGDTCGYTCDLTCSGGYTMSCGGTCNYTCDYTAGFHI